MNSNIIFRYFVTVLILIPVFSLSVYAQVEKREVEVIEIRNYLIKPEQRDTYIEGFETYLLDTLNAYGNYILGQYRVKGAEDNFVWIRGFDSMQARKPAIDNFFSSKQWAEYGHLPIEYLLGYTNVYLLEPLNLAEGLEYREGSFPAEWFGKPKGVAIVDFYIANEMLDDLVKFFGTRYDSIMRAAGVKDISYWVSENSPNNYPVLPVFQDPNLLVSIAFYKDEQEYEKIGQKIKEIMDEETEFALARSFTTQTTWVLYPTRKSFSAQSYGGKK